jgi:ATP-dependent DNA helicase RecG
LNNSASDILPASESDRVEFKATFSDEVIVSLVAFANSKGGTVYVGVADNGEVKGVQTGKETVVQWLNEIKNKTVPAVVPEVELLSIDHKTVAALHVVDYPVKPLSMKGRFYKRVANANHQMSLDEIANEHLRTLNSSWDFYIDPYHGLDVLSMDKVKRLLHQIGQRNDTPVELDPMTFLEKMEIVREGQPTFGGYLLFTKDYCSISDVQVGRFKSDITIIDSLSLDTDLFTETEAILTFIRKHLMIEYIITGEAQRTERYDYPLDAIREVVINALSIAITHHRPIQS